MLGPGGRAGESTGTGAAVYQTANAFFLVYAKSCAPSFYDQVALHGGSKAIEVTLYTDMFQSQYDRNCLTFYGKEVMPRQMAAIISTDSMFLAGEGSLSDAEARRLGESFWIEMTRERNDCANHLFAGIDLDNRVLAELSDRANFSDVVAVARGILDTFNEMQSQGFSHFRSVDERCRLARDRARALIRSLVEEGLLAVGETGV
jgi:hypothetical protein